MKTGYFIPEDAVVKKMSIVFCMERYCCINKYPTISDNMNDLCVNVHKA